MSIRPGITGVGARGADSRTRYLRRPVGSENVAVQPPATVRHEKKGWNVDPTQSHLPCGGTKLSRQTRTVCCQIFKTAERHTSFSSIMLNPRLLAALDSFSANQVDKISPLVLFAGNCEGMLLAG